MTRGTANTDNREEVRIDGAFRFIGRTKSETKRKALDFWVANRKELELSLQAFFQRCRISTDGKRITFFTTNPAPKASDARDASSN